MLLNGKQTSTLYLSSFSQTIGYLYVYDNSNERQTT